jgi:GMP synthase-like glutamine amidotransferase
MSASIQPPRRPGAQRVAVLQHVPFEGPALIGEWFLARGHRVSVRALWRGDRPPRPDECDLLVVMGGPMSVGDHDRHPWLPREIDSIRSCLEAGVPTMGVCLGAQLIAAALGARVYPAPQKEIGWWPVELGPALTASRTAPDWTPTLERLPARLTVMHWHGDTFDLPDEATRIASTPVCPNQGFVWRQATVGLQFHLESTPRSASELARACRSDIESGTWQIAASDPVAAMRRGALEHGGAARPVLEAFLGRLERAAVSR